MRRAMRSFNAISASSAAVGISRTAVSAMNTTCVHGKVRWRRQPCGGRAWNRSRGARRPDPCRVIAGHARYHTVGIADATMQAAKSVRSLLMKPVAIACQIALALQFLVEIVGIGRIVRLERRALMISMPGRSRSKTNSLGRIPHPFLAANQNSGAETLIDVGNGGTHRLFFFTFGKDDAFG